MLQWVCGNLGRDGWWLPATWSHPEPGPPAKFLMVIWIIITLLLLMITVCFSDLVDQTHEVGVSPASLVQVVRLLQHLWQLLAPNVSETQFFFFQIVVGCAMYKTYFIEAKSLSCYPKIFFPLQGKRQFWKFWTFGFGFAQTTSGFPRSWQLWSAHPLISILIQWTKKDYREILAATLSGKWVFSCHFIWT